jgi:isopenicillin-N N-acyltransferase-like protein
MLTSPGGLGWVGINEAGLGLATTDLLTLGTRISPPSLVVRRLLLGCRIVEAALTRLARLPPAGGRSYLLGDATGAVAAVELCAERPHAFAMRPHRRTAHTNHALRPEVVEWESPERLAAIYPSSRTRLARAQTLLADGADAEAVLADHDGSPASVCRHQHPSEPTRTAASVVLDCAARTAAIALGPPCESPYARVGL